MKIVQLTRKKQFPVPVPPITRRPAEHTVPISEATKLKALGFGIIKAMETSNAR